MHFENFQANKKVRDQLTFSAFFVQKCRSTKYSVLTLQNMNIKRQLKNSKNETILRSKVSSDGKILTMLLVSKNFWSKKNFVSKNVLPRINIGQYRKKFGIQKILS